MKKIIRYTIFNTKWGYFGLAGLENALLQTHLPAPKRCEIEHNLLKNHPDATLHQKLFKNLQNQITAYFEGTCVKFDEVLHIELSRFTATGGTAVKKRLLEMEARSGQRR